MQPVQSAVKTSRTGSCVRTGYCTRRSQDCVIPDIVVAAGQTKLRTGSFFVSAQPSQHLPTHPPCIRGPDTSRCYVGPCMAPGFAVPAGEERWCTCLLVAEERLPYNAMRHPGVPSQGPHGAWCCSSGHLRYRTSWLPVLPSVADACMLARSLAVLWVPAHLFACCSLRCRTHRAVAVRLRW